ncbi:MAG: sugar phosphate isomerase/epimerase family protein [Thermodesulfovibrionia bacterium]|nr:sugar phosphate isomerase/epimerase family protein [Thermodesulfovibrionia bacterium]
MKYPSGKIRPHVHVPYDAIDKYLKFIRSEKLNLEIYFGSKQADELNRDDILGLKKKLDYGPEISVHAPFMDLSPGAVDSKVREVTIQRFVDVLNYSKLLEPNVVVFHSGYDKWKYDKRVDIWLERSMETWKPINDMAADMGIKIAIENIFEEEPANLKLLMGEMNSKNFGVCFDTGHFNLFSSISLTEWIEVIKPYIAELHLHDNSRLGDDHLAIGDGIFDFNLLFRMIEGVDCVYTLEAHSIKDVKKSLKRLEEYFTKRGE